MRAVRGDAYMELKDYGHALADYKASELLWPDYRFAYERLIRLYGLMGDKAAAVAEAQKLKALDNDIAPIN
ncbi:MAG: hypothetical protein ACRD3W_16245 [Terriglobales bacterium]